jgi:hypothetical protein
MGSTGVVVVVVVWCGVVCVCVCVCGCGGGRELATSYAGSRSESLFGYHSGLCQQF